MPAFQDLTGQRFGRLTVLSRAPNGPRGQARWNLRCDCGQDTVSETKPLRAGRVVSCGCQRREQFAKRSTKHGANKTGQRTPEYQSWAAMIRRCESPNAQNSQHYIGRGIRVCERWRTFENFLADMGPRPSPSHSIDRINNDGNYEPGNCRWATRAEQARNTRRNHLIEFQGRTLCVTDWAAAIGISALTLRSRLGSGWTIERALTEPAQRKGNKCA